MNRGMRRCNCGVALSAGGFAVPLNEESTACPTVPQK